MPSIKITLVEKIVLTSCILPLPKACAARVAPPQQRLPIAEKISVTGPTMPIAPNAAGPKYCPTMILSIKMPTVAVSDVRIAETTKE